MLYEYGIMLALFSSYLKSMFSVPDTGAEQSEHDTKREYKPN